MQKYFLKQYIFDNLLVKENDLSEKELCDCLLEFSNAYICIQIKEKDASSNLSPREWFAKKVLKNAKKQIRDTFEFEGAPYIFTDTAVLNVAKTMPICLDNDFAT